MTDERKVTGVCVDIRKLIDDLKIANSSRGGLADCMRIIEADIRYSFRKGDGLFDRVTRFEAMTDKENER